MATIEIDGKLLEAEPDKMIIEVADAAGIYIPRFCYHKKLSVAANCRMCLVEVENGRKPVPACATPITNGMKVFTRSKEALHSQQAVMEFLLINHPLDCPICDQGGECELQDLSLGYGSDASQYEEPKRSVDDDNLGALISTEMTRCIHCTRCVRFGDEVAGLRELGATGRGENMQIGTYVQHAMRSEISGNIIDLCPVGALTSKPFRYSARAWELTQHDGVAVHDCLGSNIHIHVRRNQLMRVVPKENESINETWLSDRDRFSYLGLNSSMRAAQPMIKRNGQLEVVDWETALSFAANGISRVLKNHGPQEFAAFASPSSTLEELYLLQKMMRELEVHNLDHRLQQVDFRDQASQPIFPQSSLPYAELENQEFIFLLGCNIEREVPLAGVRVRKAYRNGGKIYALNPVDYDYHFPITEKIIVSPHAMVEQLAAILRACVEDISQFPASLQALLNKVTQTEESKAIALALQKPAAVIVTGALVDNHPEAATLRSLLVWLHKVTGVHRVHLTTGANCAGAWLAGMVPHRTAAGKPIANSGLDIQTALEAKLKGYCLMAAEPGLDFAHPFQARQSMLAAEFVVVLTAFNHDAIHDYADVVLPMAPFAETSGTYVNVDGSWQSTKGALSPYGEARPAWKILRVLANLLHCDGFEYTASDEITNEIKTLCEVSAQETYLPFYSDFQPKSTAGIERIGEWPLYRSDAIVRNAEALQKSQQADAACIRIHPKTAARLVLNEMATVSQGDIEITLPIQLDERIALNAIWVPNAMIETMDLGHSFAEITIRAVS